MAGMPYRGLILSFIAIASAGSSLANIPDGFHWVTFKSETDTVLKVTQKLLPESYTAIREIGIVGNWALVFTAERSSDISVPDEDRWNVYNVSMTEGIQQKLLTGYELEIKTWLPFGAGKLDDLTITFADCFGCEPTILFTALHCDPKEGWKARWPVKSMEEIPGIPLVSGGAGIPYEDEEVDQVWAAIAAPGAPVSIGTWYRSKTLKTGKIEDKVSQFFVDASTGNEKSLTLHGSKAVAWERKLCNSRNIVGNVSGGQDGKSCRALLGIRSN